MVAFVLVELLCLVTSSRSTAPIGTQMSIMDGVDINTQERIGVYTSQLQGDCVCMSFCIGSLR